MPPTQTSPAPRKSLASQLDRFDHMLDGLAEGLNDAISEAVRDSLADAVREGVRTALRELLTQPETIKSIRQSLGVPEPAEPHPSHRPDGSPPQSSQPPWWRGRVEAVTQTCSSLWSGTQQVLAVLWDWKGNILLLALIGIGFGLVAYASGPVVSAILAGLGGAAMVVVIGVLISAWSVIRSPLGLFGEHGPLPHQELIPPQS